MIGKNPITLVTGASGAIGPAIIQALHTAKHKIRTISLDEMPQI